MEIKRYNERKEALRSMTEDMMAMIRRKDFAPFNLALSGGVVKEFLPLFNQMPTFDCIILGVGEDSHTASIFPTTMELLSDSRNYAVSQQPSTGQYRITMTGPLILNGAPLLVPILGTNKEPVIQRLSKGYSPSNDTPAAYILSHAVQATIYGLNP